MKNSEWFEAMYPEVTENTHLAKQQIKKLETENSYNKQLLKRVLGNAYVLPISLEEPEIRRICIAVDLTILRLNPKCIEMYLKEMAVVLQRILYENKSNF